MTQKIEKLNKNKQSFNDVYNVKFRPETAGSMTAYSGFMKPQYSPIKSSQIDINKIVKLPVRLKNSKHTFSKLKFPFNYLRLLRSSYISFNVCGILFGFKCKKYSLLQQIKSVILKVQARFALI